MYKTCINVKNNSCIGNSVTPDSCSFAISVIVTLVMLTCEEIFVSIITLKLLCRFMLMQNNDDHGEVRMGHKAPVSPREHSNAQLKKIKLGEQPECAADVQKLCSKLSNNFAIIDCLQSDNLACIIELLAGFFTCLIAYPV